MKKLEDALWLLLALAIMALSCGKGSIGPTPLPTPTSQPSLPPPPTVPVFNGSSFIPYLVGGVVCYNDLPCPDNSGYFWMARFQRMAAAGLNGTMMRTGPYRDGSSAVSALMPAVMSANSLGFIVFIDLIDGWALRHEENAWGDACSITDDYPKQRHVDHVRAVVEATRGLGVVYTIGNEIGLCDPSTKWRRGIYGAAKEAGAVWVGDESGSPVGDFHTLEAFQTPAFQEILTEDDGSYHSPQDWIQLYRDTKAAGAYLMFWRNEHYSEQQWQELLDLYAKESK